MHLDDLAPDRKDQRFALAFQHLVQRWNLGFTSYCGHRPCNRAHISKMRASAKFRTGSRASMIVTLAEPSSLLSAALVPLCM
jgi:hypothetical protein